MVAKQANMRICGATGFTLAQFSMVAKLTRDSNEYTMRFTLAQFSMVAKPQIYSIILS